MQTIADAAGVSKSAVSLALKNDPRLPETTRDRIQKLAVKLGYQRNPVMASLMAQLRASRTPKFQSNLAWINCNEHQDMMHWHTFRDFREGARARAIEMGYGLEDFWVGESGMSAMRLKQILNARNIRGLIAAAAQRPGKIYEGYESFWGNFSCGVVGIANVEPRLPSAMVDHYQTAKKATESVLELGYRRPALVLEPALDELLDGKFSAGFHTVTKRLPAETRPPHFAFHWKLEKEFIDWYRKYQPDVIVTASIDIRKWLTTAGVSIPGEVGLAHLDLAPDMDDWAGMQQHNDQVGANAADLVIAQITRAETGPYDNPKILLINSTWVEGPSVRKQG